MNEFTTEIMDNKEIMDKIVEVTPVVTKPKMNWRKVGVGAMIVGAVGTLAVGAYCVIKKFIKAEDEQVEAVDNVKVAQHDFVEEDESEE